MNKFKAFSTVLVGALSILSMGSNASDGANHNGNSTAQVAPAKVAATLAANSRYSSTGSGYKWDRADSASQYQVDWNAKSGRSALLLRNEGSRGNGKVDTPNTNSSFQWNTSSAAEEAGFRWGIRNNASQTGFRWGIR